ncbi:MAG: mechanosensitive ion channel family protein [Nitrospira sp.]|nr:mechanosensitive ion channel family protein [Nitrospira sp.]
MTNSKKEGVSLLNRRPYFWTIAVFCWLIFPCSGWHSLHAETAAPTLSQAPLPQPIGAPVVLGEDTLFLIYDKLGPFTPQERAQAITDRLTRLAKDPFTSVHSVTATDQELTSELVHGEMVVMTITDRDAQPTGKSRQDLARDYAQKIQTALSQSHEQFSIRALIIDAAWALLDTAILIVLLVLFHKTFPKIYAKIEAWRGTIIRPIRIQRVELLSADQIATALTALAKTIRIVAVLVLFYVYLTTVLGIFPWTRGISAALFGAVVSTLQAIGQAFATYIPNVVSIAVIIVVTRYILKMISLLFVGIERGAITLTGFHREWAEPTYKIVRFLVIVFAAIACFPYIPGSQSEGFRGISVFLGLLISLGSAAAIGNVVAGVVLTYMRPFRVGDRVKIADTMGDVMEKTLLVTRVRTIKNVDVTIPNAMVLGSHLINFSSVAKEQGLILHTRVTIGYDAPWRTVHALLISAARATTHILASPEPFVLQTSLDDFYVTYEINAYTDQANLMATIYAELHRHIQDQFNEAGVEIMSPHYAQIRDGNQTTIPDQYLPKTYQAPSFRLGPLGNLFRAGPDPESPKGGPKP